MPVNKPDPLQGFATGAPIYLEAGWLSPLPVPHGQKTPVPSGFTGHKGEIPTLDRFQQWMCDRPSDNLAIRMPSDVIGIDVDAYKGKKGAQMLAEGEKRHGQLRLPGPSSSSRGWGVSRIRFFRVPPGTMFPGKIECLVDGEKTSDIEIIQRHHRYAVVWPSVHPEGGGYQWFDADGDVMDGPPRIEDIPELPQTWLEGLSEKDKKTRASNGGTAISDRPLYDVTEALTEGEPSEKVAKRLGEAIFACYGGSRHDAVCGHVLALLRFGKNGETGVLPALEALRIAFVGAVADDREGGEAAADAEFMRLIENADKKLGDDELRFGDDWTRRGAPADDRQQASRDQRGSSDVIEGMPRLWNAADLRPAAQPRWLAKNRLPRAAVSLLVGDEGIGKSLMWVWLVAAVTTGKPLPEFGVPSRNPAEVIVVVTEDDWATTVRPRLEVARADLSRISVICTEEDGSGAPTFPRDLFLIGKADPAPALVVVDAWLDTVPGTLSVRDPQQARQALHPWRELATMTDAAVLLLTHTNRVASVAARDKYGARGELRKKARMTLWAQQDQAGHLVVGPEKANGAAPVSAAAFEMRPVPYFPSTEDHDGTVPLLAYVAESAQTAREHVAESYAAGHGSGSTNDDLVAWLASFLAEGPRWVKEIYVAALAAGFSSDKAKRAKRRLGVGSDRETSTGPWYWLPQHSGARPGSGV